MSDEEKQALCDTLAVWGDMPFPERVWDEPTYPLSIDRQTLAQRRA